MLKRNVFTKFSIIFVLTLLFVSFIFYIHLNAITVSPPLIDLNINRGESYDGEFAVIFKQDDPEQYYLYVKKLEFEDYTNNQITSDPGTGESTLANWVTLENNVVKKPEIMGLKNGDNVVVVHYNVSIPIDASPGAHYAQIIVSQKSEDSNSKGSQVSLGSEIGYQILVNLKGERVYSTDLIDFKTKDNQFIFPSLPAYFETTFKNAGNVYVTPNANIEIFEFGNKIDNIVLNPRQYRVFPNHTKTYDNLWSEEGIEDLTDQTRIDGEMNKLPKTFMDYVNYELKHFRIGIYSAEIQGFAGAQAPFKSSVNFIVIPYHLLSIILGIIVIVFFVGRLTKKDKKHRRK